MEILAVVSDLHCNSRQGLMPPSVTLNEGGVHYASTKQLWIWDRWLAYWKTVADLKKKMKARVVTLINGEVCDMNKHGSTELVSADTYDAIEIGMAALDPARDVTDKFIVSLGTEAHVGGNGLLDRLAADALGAEAHHWNRFSVGDLRIDAAHHPKMNTRRKWTKGSAAIKISLDLEIDYYRQGWQLPHIALRGHVHVPQDSGLNSPIRTWILPSWKLTDSFVNRLGDPFPAPIGGMVFWKKKDKDVKFRRYFYEWPIAEEEAFPRII